MEARSRSSTAPVMPLTLGLSKSHSPTRHLSSPSSSSTFNLPLTTTHPPTRAGFRGHSSYSSSTSAVASSSIYLGLDRYPSQVRSAGRPVSLKGGATMKPIPCAPPKQTCMCSPTNHPVKCEEVCHEEFGGKNRQCGRRMGEKNSHCSHTPLQPQHTRENVFSAAAQQALLYDHCPRCLLKFASGCPVSRLGFSPFRRSVSNGQRILKEISACMAAEQHTIFLSAKDFTRSYLDKML